MRSPHRVSPSSFAAAAGRCWVCVCVCGAEIAQSAAEDGAVAVRSGVYCRRVKVWAEVRIFSWKFSGIWSTSEAGLRSERPGWLLRGAAGDVRTQWETVRDSNSISPPGLVCKDTGAGAGTQRGVRSSSDRAGRLRHREELSCEPRGSRGGRACVSWIPLGWTLSVSCVPNRCLHIWMKRKAWVWSWFMELMHVSLLDLPADPSAACRG